MMERVYLDAQTSVLGALLIDPRICGELFAETEASDFRSAAHRRVYEAARALFFEGRTVDAVTVLNQLGGGAETRQFLGELIEVTPTAANWREHAALLRREARLARLQEVGRSIQAAPTLEEALGLVQRAQAEGSSTVDGDAVRLANGMFDFLQRQVKEVRYVRFGIGRLDERLYASLGDFIVIGGRPSAGKTLLSIQLANVLSEEYRVGYFSLETSPEKIYDRYFSHAMQLDFERIKRHELDQEDHIMIARKKDKLLKHNMEVIRAGGYTVEKIQAETLQRRYQVIFVDYLQLVGLEKGGASSRTEEVSAVSRALHKLSQVHGVLVIALAQLSRAPKGSTGLPSLNDLRESGQIEQDADVVMLLSRSPENDDRILQVAKNKEGGTGKFALSFDPRHQQLVEYMENA